nr:transposase, MuDR, MULE transposase domain protein [Tanacetum cinerariifolium]
MLDELGLGNGGLLFSHFKIQCTCFDDGLVPLMADKDVVKLLQYVPRFKEVNVYVEEDVLVVEQHMIEVRFTNEHSKGLVIEEIVEEKLTFRNKIAEIKEKSSQENPKNPDIFADLDQAYEEDVHLHLDEANKVELELEDEIVVVEIFVDLDEAYKDDVDSHLDEALILEEVEDFGMFYNSVKDASVDEPNEVELEVEMR